MPFLATPGRGNFYPKRNMKWRETVTAYFSFTHREFLGVITLMIIIVLVFVLPKFLPNPSPVKLSTEDSLLLASLKFRDDSNTAADSIKRFSGTDARWQKQNTGSGSVPQLFFFDPNKLDAAGWQKLGVKDKTIRTILKYLSKGGRFSKPEELARIYGLSEKLRISLMPFVRIEAGQREWSKETLHPEKPKAKETRIIDINKADSTQWESLPGIGGKLASRIMLFREKLGGFYKIEQVGETFGLADSVFQNLKKYLAIEERGIRKININTATLEELKAHPYIRYAIAKAIVAYRNEHGLFLTVEEIMKVKLVTEEIFNRVKPYLVN